MKYCVCPQKVWMYMLHESEIIIWKKIRCKDLQTKQIKFCVQTAFMKYKIVKHKPDVFGDHNDEGKFILPLKNQIVSLVNWL